MTPSSLPRSRLPRSRRITTSGGAAKPADPVLEVLTDAGRLAAKFSLLQRGALLLDAGPIDSAAPATSAPPTDAVKSRPRLARAEATNGIQLIRAGKSAARIAALRRALKLNPGDAGIHHDLGLAYLQLDQCEEAGACLARAVALDPNLPGAYVKLGIALDRLGRGEAAIGAFAAATQRQPTLSHVHRRLGELYRARGDLIAAGGCFRAAAAASAGTERCLDEARAELMASNYTGAEHLLRRIIAEKSDCAEAYALLAQAMANTGRAAEAADCFTQAATRDPLRAESWYGVALNRKFHADDRPLIDRMRASLAKPGLSAQLRSVVHFAIGKALDDLGDYETAIQAFDEANRLRRLTCRLDRTGLSRRIERLIADTPPGFLTCRPGLGDHDPRPIFVIGMPRSGTTLLQQILSNHPDVAAGGELPYWGSLNHKTRGVLPAETSLDQARQMIEDYRDILRRVSPNALRVTDKMPVNFLMLGLICPLLPRATIVHCRRHPVDTCLSIYTTSFDARIDFANDRGSLVFYYRQYLRLMQHWRSVMPGRLIEVDYEDLVTEPELVTRRLVALCGLEWNDACLAPHLNRRAVTTSSYWQARQPTYRTSIERWRRYEPWLGELRDLLG